MFRLVSKKTQSYASAVSSQELCEVMFCQTATGEMRGKSCVVQNLVEVLSLHKCDCVKEKVAGLGWAGR